MHYINTQISCNKGADKSAPAVSPKTKKNTNMDAALL